MLNFPKDNIFVVFGGTVFQQTILIPMGTITVLLSWQICSCILMKPNSSRIYCLKKQNTLAASFRYLDNVISIKFMINYTLYTVLIWKSKRPLKLLHLLLISVYYTFCDWWEHFNQVVWQA